MSPPSDLLGRVLAELPAGAEIAVVRRRETGEWLVGVDPDAAVVGSGPAALAALDRLGGGWWAGWLAYDLGRAVERVRPRPAPSCEGGRPSDDLPDVSLRRFDTRLVIGRRGVRVEGGGPSRPILLGAVNRARNGPRPKPRRRAAAASVGPFRSSLSRSRYEAGVAAVVDLILDGRCYQVNLTRRLEADGAVDPVALFGALRAANPAPHAALCRFGADAVVSASPERFLRRRGGQRGGGGAGALVETRPIKGTGTSPGPLLRSAKERAENVMITDLARNDLGRVCVPGTITVPQLCGAEPHPGLWHLVSTVTGRLRPGVGTGELVAATFPPASVTGAPKPAVLQIIEDIEPVRRGLYCGAVGWIDEDTDELDLAVTIRTFVLRPGRVELGVGAGITAGSDPTAEWAETELKAAGLRRALDQLVTAGTAGAAGAPGAAVPPAPFPGARAQGTPSPGAAGARAEARRERALR